MKPRCSNQRNHALTLTEVLVSVAIVGVLAGVAYLVFHRPKAVHRIVLQDRSTEIQCVNNLKQISIAFRIWEGDNNDKFPMRIPKRKGGAMEAAARGDVAPIFQVMSNELSTPKVLLCPADASRFAVGDFTAGFDNSHVSYFVGVDADDAHPQMLLSGDSNLAVNGKPAKSGLLTITKDRPITWTSDRHIHQGNLGFTDGSVWQGADDQKLGNVEGRLALP